MKPIDRTVCPLIVAFMPRQYVRGKPFLSGLSPTVTMTFSDALVAFDGVRQNNKIIFCPVRAATIIHQPWRMTPCSTSPYTLPCRETVCSTLPYTLPWRLTPCSTSPYTLPCLETVCSTLPLHTATPRDGMLHPPLYTALATDTMLHFPVHTALSRDGMLHPPPTHCPDD